MIRKNYTQQQLGTLLFLPLNHELLILTAVITMHEFFEYIIN